MQAIVTKYLGPTNYRGSRVKVMCDAKTMTVSWSHEDNTDDNHDFAVRRLCAALGWCGTLVRGGLPLRMPFANVYVFRKRTDGRGGKGIRIES